MNRRDILNVISALSLAPAGRALAQDQGLRRRPSPPQNREAESFTSLTCQAS